MALFREFYEPCTRLVKAERPDGHGGQAVEWEDGEPFSAAVVPKTSAVVVVGQGDTLDREYTVTAPVGTALAFHDAFRRERDGQTFRVTSDPADKETPARASFKFEQVQAEAWEVPDVQQA